MIFKIVDGRSCFYQWDIDRQISVSDPTITEVHFCNRTEACSLVVEVKDGIANVPNKVLQNGYQVRVFGYDGKATLHEATFEVKARTKPIDYVYTEVEIKNYETALEYIDEKLEDIVNNGVKVDLTDYYTKEEVDTAIYNSQDAYYLSFLETPVGAENAIEATPEMIEFAEHYGENQNVCLYVSDGYNSSMSSYVPAQISGLPKSRIILNIGSIDPFKAINNGFVRYYRYYLTKRDGQWTQYKETVGKLTIATKEYVDDAIANLDIPEADVDLTGYATEEYVNNAISNIEIPEVDLSSCIKFYNFSSLANPSEADYAKLKEIMETDDINAYLFTVESTHKVLRTSDMGGGVILIVYGVWNGPTNNTIYGYQVDYKNATSTLLVSYKMTSSEEVQSMINEAFNNIGVAEGGAY